MFIWTQSFTGHHDCDLYLGLVNLMMGYECYTDKHSSHKAPRTILEHDIDSTQQDFVSALNQQLDHNLEDNSLFQTHDPCIMSLLSRSTAKHQVGATFKLADKEYDFSDLLFPDIRELALCLHHQSYRSGWDDGLGRETDDTAATVSTVTIVPPMHTQPDLMSPMPQHRRASSGGWGWICEAKPRYESKITIPLYTSDNGHIFKIFHFFLL